MNTQTRWPKISVVLSSVVLSILLLVGLARADLLQGVLFTPTAYVYMPAIFKQPTPTPTPTRTPTLTPTITPTPTTVPPTPSSLTGQLVLCNPAKTTYTKSELVCVVETITNNNDFTINYGLLGVNIIGPHSWFQTSWSNTSIGPHCTGPKNICEGSWQDNLRGYDDTAGFKTPGIYVMFLGICYSSISSCRSSQGAWQNFTPGVTIAITN